MLSWAEHDAVVPSSDWVGEVLPSGDVAYSARARRDTVLGDVIFEMDVQTPTGDNQLLGVEFDGAFFYITGGNAGWDPNKIYVIDTAGNVILDLDQPDLPDYWGWRDLAWDGAYVGSDRIDTLYGSCGQYVHKFGIRFTDSTLVHHGSFPGPAYPLNRALAYMEDSAWFFTSSGDTSSYNYKFSKTALRIDSCINDWFMYGAAYDNEALGGGYVWWHSQDYTGTPFHCLIEQMDPYNMNFTGVVFDYAPTTITSGIAGGLCFYEDFRGMDVLFALVQGDPTDIIVGIFVRNHMPGVAEEPRVEECYKPGMFSCVPNPTRGRTAITYEAIGPTEVLIYIYDRAGNLVKTLVDDGRTGKAGRRAYWEGDDDQGRSLPGGVYFVKLLSPQFVGTSKIILLR